MQVRKDEIIQAKTDLRKLKTRFYQLKINGGYDIDDQRYASLDNLEGELVYMMVLLENFSTQEFNCISHLKQLPGVTNDNYEIVRLNFSRFLKKTLLTILMFSVEVLFSSISVKLPGGPTRFGFQNLVNHVLTESKLSDWEKKSKIVNLPTKLRNVLHANGRFTDKQKFEAEIYGKTYTLETGKQIDFVTWKNIPIFLNAMCDVIDEMLNSSKVKDDMTKIELI